MPNYRLIMTNEIAQKTRTQYCCKICHYNTSRKNDYDKHLLTDKHKNLTIPNTKAINVSQVAHNFYCDVCNYTTCYKKCYDKHLTSLRHYNNLNKSNLKENNLACACGNKYSHRSTLSKHKKTCKEIIKTDITTDMVLKILEQNKQLSDIIVNQNKQINEIVVNQNDIIVNQNKQMNEIVVNQNEIIVNQNKQMNEMIPKIGNTNNTINNNQKLNINIFLNEKCKDAMSMDNFLKTIEVSLSNLLVTKEKGLAEGITNIIVENMNKLPINQRPIHCTDVKRETIYIKNETWEKDENKEKTKEAIKKISCIQTKNIKKWTEANPNYMEKEKLKDEYIYLIKHISDDVKEKEEKIIKNICKNSYINDKLIEN